MADLATLQAEKQRREQLAALEAEKARRSGGATTSTSPHAGRREKRARTIQRESQQYQNQQANKSRIAQKNENAKTLQAMGVPALTHGQERIGAGALAMQNALTFGQADRLNAGVSQAFDGGSFKDNLSNARQTRQNLREEHPYTSIGTELATYMVPGAAGYIKGAQMLGNPAVGVVGNMLSRAPKVVQDGAKYATRLGGMGAAGMGDAYVYNSTIGASNREAEQGRDVGLAERNQMGTKLATHPLSMFAGPGLSAAYRTGKYARSGQFTPSWVEGGSPELPAIDVLETRAPSIRPETVSALERIVMNSTDLPRGDVRAAIEVAGKSLRDGDSFAFALPRAIERELAKQFPGRFDDGIPGLREQIYDLSAQRGRGDRGGEIIGGRLKSDAAGDVPLLTETVEGRLGSQGKFSEGQLSAERLSQIGSEGYEPYLARGVTDPDGGAALQQYLTRPGLQSLMQPLKTIAAASDQVIDVDQMIARDPLRAAHWMRHKAGRLAYKGSDPQAAAYGQMRDALDQLIEGAAPGYSAIRRQYGDEAQIQEALRFGDRFLSQGQKAEQVDELAYAYSQLSDLHKEAAKLSIRDALLNTQRGIMEGQAARLTRSGGGGLNTAGTLEALEKVLGEDGVAIANQIRAISKQQGFRKAAQAGVGSNTTDKANARLTAPLARSGPLGSLSTPGSFMSNAVVDAGLMIAGAPVPVVTPVRAAAKMIGKIAQPGPQIRNELADILSAPARRSVPQQATPQAPPPPSGGPPPTAPMVPSSADGPLATPPIGPQLGLDDLDARAPVASATPPSLTPSAFEIDQMEREALRIAEPRRLTQWVKERGGLRDNGYSRGDITSIIGEVRARPGLINNSGEEADTMARKAYEEGYFTSEPDVDDFLRALDDDFSGRTPVYSANDAQLVDEYLNAQDTLKMVDRLRAESPTNVTPMGLSGTYVPEATGATIGGTIAPDLDEDGQISGAERAGGIVAGVAASRGAKRINNRVTGSGNLPKDVKREGERYTVLPNQSGGLQANVIIGESTPKQSLPSFGENKRYWDEQARQAEGNPERLAEIPALKREDALNLPEEKARVMGENAADAVNAKRLIRRDGDQVLMSFTGDMPRSAREIHDKFEATYRALEDHAVRFRRPKYEFTGAGAGHDRTYARKLRQMGPPKGYVGVIYSSKKSDEKYFELLREDVYFMRKARGEYKNAGNGVEIVHRPQTKTPPQR